MPRGSGANLGLRGRVAPAGGVAAAAAVRDVASAAGESIVVRRWRVALIIDCSTHVSEMPDRQRAQKKVFDVTLASSAEPEIMLDDDRASLEGQDEIPIVDSVQANERVGSAIQRVDAPLVRDHLVSADDPAPIVVVTGAARQRVVASIPVKGVVALAALENVVALPPIEVVVAVAAEQRIAAIAPL